MTVADPILFQKNFNVIAESRQMLVHGIVHDLIDQMVQSFSGNAADIHARAFSHRLQAFQHRNTSRIICCPFAHTCLLSSLTKKLRPTFFCLPDPPPDSFLRVPRSII